jgi:hypothetical protein
MAAKDENRRDWEVAPMDRLDEAFVLLKSLPAVAWLWWVAGSVPMVLGLLFCWADQSRGGAPVLEPPVWAVGLAGLYGWGKVSQAFFARAVWARLIPDGGVPAMRWADWFGRSGALLAIASIGLPVQMVAAVLVLPFPWVLGLLHHATALAYTRDAGRRPLRELAAQSVRLTLHETLGHLISLLLLAVLGLLVWGSVFALGLVLPYLLKVLAGVESAVSQNPSSLALSPLFLFVVSSVAWMIMSPYIRVVYALRCFHSVSRRTGHDLLGRLHALRGPVAAVLALLLLMSGACRAADTGIPGGTSSVPVTVEVEAADPQPLAQAIETTLASRHYQWRLPRAGAADQAAQKNGLVEALKRAGQQVRRAFTEMKNMLSEAGRALRRIFGGESAATPGTGSSGVGWADRILRVGLVVTAVLAVLLGIGCWLRARRRPKSGTAASAGPAAGPVSLTDDTTLASALPEDEWLKLARQELERGEGRLAVRAAFLATLAALNERRLLDIARTKSNCDYVTELRVRAAGRAEMTEVFVRSVSVFERAWYGLHEVSPAWLQELFDNHRRLTTHDPAA